MERKKLTVKGVEEIKRGTSKASGKPYEILTFSATDDTGKEMVFKTLTTSLFPMITPGAVLDAEFEVKDSEQYGVERNLRQIYKDGQPASAPKGGGYRGKSPEELELSRRAYALSYSKDLAVAGKIEIKQIFLMATDMEKWLSTGNLPGVK